MSDWIRHGDAALAGKRVIDQAGRSIDRVTAVKRAAGGLFVRVLHSTGGRKYYVTANDAVVEFEAFVPGAALVPK